MDAGPAQRGKSVFDSVTAKPIPSLKSSSIGLIPPEPKSISSHDYPEHRSNYHDHIKNSFVHHDIHKPTSLRESTYLSSDRNNSAIDGKERQNGD